MNDRAMNPRQAAEAIADSGIVDDVIQTGGDDRELTGRRGDREDQPRSRKDRKRARLNERNARQRDDDDRRLNDDDDDFDEDDGDDFDYDDTSNRRRGEADDDEADEDDDADDDDRDDDDEAEDDDDEEGDDRESEADPLDVEYKVKIDGETRKVTLREALQGYQRTEDYHRKTRALSDTARSFQEGHAKVAKDYQARLAHTGNLIKQVRDVLIGDIDSEGMRRLQMEDPAAYNVQRFAIQDRIAKIDGFLGQVSNEWKQHTERLNAQQTEDRNKLVGVELDRITRGIPDWDKGGAQRLVKYLGVAGFKTAELDGVIDSRMWLIAEKARKYDALQRKQQRTTKTLQKKRRPAEKAPRSTQKGPQRGENRTRRASGERNRNRRQFNDARKRLRQTGSMRDAGDAIKHLID